MELSSECASLQQQLKAALASKAQLQHELEGSSKEAEEQLQAATAAIGKGSSQVDQLRADLNAVQEELYAARASLRKKEEEQQELGQQHLQQQQQLKHMVST